MKTQLNIRLNKRPERVGQKVHKVHKVTSHTVPLSGTSYSPHRLSLYQEAPDDLQPETRNSEL